MPPRSFLIVLHLRAGDRASTRGSTAAPTSPLNVDCPVRQTGRSLPGASRSLFPEMRQPSRRSLGFTNQHCPAIAVLRQAVVVSKALKRNTRTKYCQRGLVNWCVIKSVLMYSIFSLHKPRTHRRAHGRHANHDDTSASTVTVTMTRSALFVIVRDPFAPSVRSPDCDYAYA